VNLMPYGVKEFYKKPKKEKKKNGGKSGKKPKRK